MAKARSKKKTRLEAVTILPHVIRRLLGFSDADLLLREVLTLANEALGADEVSLLLLDPAGRELVEHEVVGKKLRPTTHTLKLRLREEGITGWVASHRLPQVVPDVRKDRRYLKVSSGTRSEAAVPILEGDRLLGVLNFESRKVGYFQKGDLELLGFLASQLAIALKMVELDRRSRQWQERLAALHNLARLGGVVPKETILQRTVDAVRMTCGGHYAAVFQGDYEREELVLLAHSSAHPVNIAVGARQKFGKGLIGKAFELGETVNVRDVRQDPMYVFRVPGVVSEVCVPIRVGDNCLGILDAQAQTVGEFTTDEVMFLETVSRFLAPVFQSPAPVR
jgi:putative methionine-R-sulfoxide reductase with GAF domain